MGEVQSVVAAITSKCSGGECVATMLNDELKRETMNVGLKMVFSRRFGVKPTKEFTMLRNAGQSTQKLLHNRTVNLSIRQKMRKKDIRK